MSFPVLYDFLYVVEFNNIIHSLMKDGSYMMTLTKIEFDVHTLGYSDIELDTRAIVFARILRELNIEYRKYYTRLNNSHTRKLRKPDILWDDMNVIFVAYCPPHYEEFVKYLYQKRLCLLWELEKLFDL